ncbi:MAG TPA: ceramidase domain-containing protein [Amaricoccus sp.]|uniref:ceramidase domain-containing protein n=2 Tax=Amaricoccus sp. TaxID=1872485 RepID=UPI002B8A875B|nr:ceramidase domain-containing protein [Amaricoccus sp.]HMQ92817.1 ceramidase domain-containing protein [Amaricoccus sp.]HMR60025.1 ceramidase domain-containing protein [Amaricoccus sp.]HMU00476.1 ceramidase domain-containing protein [Amaricoccus sp.]
MIFIAIFPVRSIEGIMDWFRVVDNYCERVDAGYWSEPVNALTNGAFLVAAIIAWRIAARRGDRGGQLLAAVLFAIGVGSYLFHTHAQIWSMMADVLPIQAFILIYLYLATVRFFALPWWGGILAVAAFIPYSILVARGLGALVGDLNGSIGYLPVPILIAGYAFLLRRRAPATARGMAFGAAMLAVSLVFRSIDAAVCPAVPLGTHFFWHILNAVMLGWMIAVLVRHGR